MINLRRSSLLVVVAAITSLLAPVVSQGRPNTNKPQAKPKTPNTMRLPQAVVLPVGKSEIKIDGSLVDWPKLPAMQLNDRSQLSGTGHGAWRGLKDLSALVFMMWGEEGLYISCTAQDEWHRALDVNTLLLTEIPAADSLVLSFDPDRNTRSNGPDPGRRDDREFWLADEKGREVVQWDRLRGTARVLPDPARMVVLHDKEHGITTYEALIPWSEILPPGKQPYVSLCVDMQMVLNDFDESTDAMPQTRMGWTFGHGPVVDPGLLGTLMLVGDNSPMRGVMPEFPAKPGTAESPAKPIDYWREMSARLIQNEAITYDGTLTPAETGGMKRLKVLEELDEHLARFPRVDNLELFHRIHRRMNREVAGLMGRGLPYWWRLRMQAVSKQAADVVMPGAVRLFRLPMGGWLVRSATKSYLIDAAGNDVAEWLWGGAEMCLLTQPLTMVRRNDQLLLRMFTAKPVRPVYAHIVFHLPVVAMEKMPLVVPGKGYATEPATSPNKTGTTVHSLGRKSADGSVPYDLSYRIETIGCPSVMIVGPTLKAEDVEEKSVGVMIASSRNIEIVVIANKVKPGVILFDDAFLASNDAKVARVTLGNIHQLQRSLLPHKSVVIAPGESWTAERQ
jgi:hypothetical protein